MSFVIPGLNSPRVSSNGKWYETNSNHGWVRKVNNSLRFTKAVPPKIINEITSLRESLNLSYASIQLKLDIHQLSAIAVVLKSNAQIANVTELNISNSKLLPEHLTKISDSFTNLERLLVDQSTLELWSVQAQDFGLLVEAQANNEWDVDRSHRQNCCRIL